MEDEFLARYPEFANVDRSRISLALSDAALELSARVWGKLYQRGIFALAAHLLYVGGAFLGQDDDHGNPNRLAASESVGSVSVSYVSPDSGFSSNHQGLALTTYGQEYLRLLRLTARHFLVV